MKRVILGLVLLALVIGISGCKPQLSEGDVNVTVSAGFDAGWSQQYWELDFGVVNRCDVTNSEAFAHGLEAINNGLTPVNMEMRYTDALLTDPDSKWQFKAECTAINTASGNTYAFAGDCWDGPGGIQSTYIDIPSSDGNVVTCLNYRASGNDLKPGIRMDNELNVSCSEAAEAKYGLLAVTFTQAVPATDCGGDSGYDPGV
jgi:hypothetical protein